MADPETPKRIHQLDQAVAGLRDMGLMFAALYRGLVEGGMTVGQALAVTCAYASGLAQRGPAQTDAGPPPPP